MIPPISFIAFFSMGRQHTQIERYWFWTLLALGWKIQTVEPKAIVGNNIRAHRKRIGITQEALAHRCDMHPVEIGRAERGVRDLRVSTVAKVAHGLKIAASELLRGV
jgi:DNA-binding XRE family transcriptional regulator